MTQLARRQLLTSLAGVPLATLPLATILADARLARAQADQLRQMSVTTAGGHQVSNPSGGRYDEEDAKLAWQRTLGFVGEYLEA